MQLTLGTRTSQRPRASRSSAARYYRLVEIILTATIAVQGARLVWAIATPLGPIGDWTATTNAPVVDAALLTRFDPFFRLGAATGTVVVTTVPLKLFGTRVDQVSGRGSAIIATPDGVQASFAVGDEILPGITLKAVAIDGITIARAGAAEQLFLDQSVAPPGPAALK